MSLGLHRLVAPKANFTKLFFFVNAYFFFFSLLKLALSYEFSYNDTYKQTRSIEKIRNRRPGSVFRDSVFLKYLNSTFPDSIWQLVADLIKILSLKNEEFFPFSILSFAFYNRWLFFYIQQTLKLNSKNRKIKKKSFLSTGLSIPTNF